MPISPRHVPSVQNRRGVSVWHMNVSDVIFRKAEKVPLRDLAVFCRKTAFLLDAGLPIKTIMLVLAKQTTGRVLGLVILDLHRMVMQGESFSNALRDTGGFPEFMCGYIAIGENTARLPEVFARIADFYEARVQTEEELAAAMMYPVAVALMMLGVIVMAVTFVLPGYSRIFDASGVALPPPTAALLFVSDFIAANTLVVFGGFFALVFAVLFFLRSEKGRTLSAYTKLKIPIQRQNINRNITQAISFLLASGIGVSEAVLMCGDIVDNSMVKKDLQKISAQIKSGRAFCEALQDVSYLNPLLAGLAKVGEETGSLPQTMEKCNVYFETAYKHSIRRLNKLIEPVITLVLGIILATVMLAIILPTFELATAI